MADATKLVLEVFAGVIPGEPMPELTRRWALTYGDIEDGHRMADAQGAALNYAALLQNPQRVNWVRLDWVWL